MGIYSYNKLKYLHAVPHCEVATSSSTDAKCDAGKDSSNETGGHALLIGSSVGAVTVILFIAAVLVVMVVVCRKRHTKTKTSK